MRKMATRLGLPLQSLIWGSLCVGQSAWAQATYTGTGDQLTEIPDTTPTPEEDAEEAKKKDTYTIQKKDTLWSILADFGEDPYSWPNLWSLNDQITNPHWIYPDNKIVFNRSTLLEAAGFERMGSQGNRLGAG